jgi:hypothetical protein
MEPVHFNTTFLYRFGSDGITSFGGEEYGLFDTDTITWTADDIPLANTTLQEMKEEGRLPDIDFNSYEKNKSGTEKLIVELVVKGGIPNEYLMGCAICHQLQYKVPLEAIFLTGEPNDYNSDCDTCNDDKEYFDEESITDSKSE